MQFQNLKEKIIIIDFGSQVTKLIARRVRDLGVFSEIIAIKDLKKIKSYNKIKGIILSGGPSTVTKKKFPSIPKEIFQKKPWCLENRGHQERLMATPHMCAIFVIFTILHSFYLTA